MELSTKDFVVFNMFQWIGFLDQKELRELRTAIDNMLPKK